jgi:hypothetical protein
MTPLAFHTPGQHVAVVAIAGDNAVVRADGVLHADDHRLLADIEMAESADQAHAIHLAGLFLETADQQHLPVIGQKLVAIRRLQFGALGLLLGRRHDIISGNLERSSRAGLMVVEQR